MSSFSIKVVDDTAFVIMDRSVVKCKEGVRRGLLDVGPEIEREAVRRIKSPPKTGRYYFRGGHLHQASAPGESPADWTGTLAESVGFEVSSPREMKIGTRAAIAPYGGAMEFGTKDGMIAPRPFLMPSVLSKAREIKQSIEKAVGIQLGKKI